MRHGHGHIHEYGFDAEENSFDTEQNGFDTEQNGFNAEENGLNMEKNRLNTEEQMEVDDHPDANNDGQVPLTQTSQHCSGTPFKEPCEYLLIYIFSANPLSNHVLEWMNSLQMKMSNRLEIYCMDRMKVSHGDLSTIVI